MSASRSVDFIGAKSVPVVTIGKEKISFIVTLSCLSTEHRLSVIAIFKDCHIFKENFPAVNNGAEK